MKEESERSDRCRRRSDFSGGEAEENGRAMLLERSLARQDEALRVLPSGGLA